MDIAWTLKLLFEWIHHQGPCVEFENDWTPL